MDIGINTRFKKGHTAWNKGKKTGYAPWLGKKRDVGTLLKLQLGRIKYFIEHGHPMSGRHHSQETREKISTSNKYKPKLKISGKNHYNWKGGTKSARQKVFASIIYRKWRDTIFIRGNYACQNCGKVGGILNAHHTKEYAFHPKLRLDINNGITLCKTCHLKTNNYGIRKPKTLTYDGDNVTDISVWT